MSGNQRISQNLDVSSSRSVMARYNSGSVEKLCMGSHVFQKKQESAESVTLEVQDLRLLII